MVASAPNEERQPEYMAVSCSIHDDNFDPGNEDNGTVTISVQQNGSAEKGEKEFAKVESGEEDRGGWENKKEFVLAIFTYSVGLGNVWRFPYLAQKNGGGAFLIPFGISLAFLGIPLFLMELAIGQRLRRGPLHVWNKLSPYLTGVGLSSVVISFLICCYYNMIVAWCFYYLFISFQADVPYVKCPCIEDVACNETHGIPAECAISSPTTYFWYRGALDTTGTIDDSGVFNWKLCLCLLLAWIVIFSITSKGVESMGKAVYFTAIFPYVVLIIFFIRTLMLDGALDGIKHMFTPQFAQLAKLECWLDASTQIFYSLGLSFGGLISMASYNQINNNIVRDALLVSIANSSTSIFSGVVIFGILGYKATVKYNKCIATGDPRIVCDLTTFLDDVVQGPGLTFIAFTEAMSTMDVTQLWSVMFFMMLLTLGIGGLLGTYETVRTTVSDLNIIPFRKEFVSMILCTISFGFGLLFCQGSGQYWLQMFDSVAASFSLLSIAILEMVIIIYIYGYNRFEDDMKFMLGKKPSIYWKVMLKYFTPVLTFILICASLYGIGANGIKYTRWDSKQGKTHSDNYPNWAKAIAILLIVASVISIPITAILMKLNLVKMDIQPINDSNDGDEVIENESAGQESISKS